MTDPLKALVAHQHRQERDERDKASVSHSGAAILEADLMYWQHGKLADRIARAQALVAKAMGQSNRPIVAFSGGKDSIATAALVHSVAPSVPLLWSDDELEYPDVVSYMRALYHVAATNKDEPPLIWLQGATIHAGWFVPWRDEPYFRDADARMLPLLDGDDSRTWAAEQGYDCTFLGLRMAESRRRRDWLVQAGPLYETSYGTRWHCCPVWDWSEAEIWALIAGWELPYPATYDHMAEGGVPRNRQRTGPLPLASLDVLESTYPYLLEKLEHRYGRRWK